MVHLRNDGLLAHPIIRGMGHARYFTMVKCKDSVVVTVIYIFVNLLVDLVQAALDPRIRIGRGGEA